MSKRKVIALTITLICGLLVVGGGVWAISSDNYAINWNVVGGGGGHSSSADYTLDGSAGQPVVGGLSNGSYQLETGYWCGMAAPGPPPGHKVYLPIILKSYP